MIRSFVRKLILPVSLAFILLVSFGVLSAIARPVPYNGDALTMPGTASGFSRDFHPVHMKGLRIDPDNTLRFEFIMDPGDSNLTRKELNSEAQKIVRYFFSALTVPEENVWVDLSPYQHHRVIPDQLAETQMGHDLLKQDFLLKQVTASVLFPHHDLGREFWLRVFHRSRNELGIQQIPVDTFSKIWIVPEKAVVHVDGNAAYVHQTRLKILLEDDFSAHSANRQLDHFVISRSVQQASDLTHDIMREVVLPELEEEINFGENFAPLRQIYHTLILAEWYKRQLRDNALGEVDLDNLENNDFFGKQAAEKIYQGYLKTFAAGVDMAFPADIVPSSAPVARQYFSGGVQFGSYLNDVYQEETDTLNFQEIEPQFRTIQQAESHR